MNKPIGNTSPHMKVAYAGRPKGRSTRAIMGGVRQAFLCVRCAAVKDKTEFSAIIRPPRKLAASSWCKRCHVDYVLKAREARKARARSFIGK